MDLNSNLEFLAEGVVRDCLLMPKEELYKTLEQYPYYSRAILRIIDQFQQVFASQIAGIYNSFGHPEDWEQGHINIAISCAESILELSKIASVVYPFSKEEPEDDELAVPIVRLEKTISPAQLAEIVHELPIYRILNKAEGLKREISPKLLDFKEKLHQFIKDHDRGQGVRFDRFMHEHQFGDNGFYSKFLDFNSDGGIFVATPSATTKGYVSHIASKVFNQILDYIDQETKAGRSFIEEPFRFVELGGGAGQFKRELLEYFDGFMNEGNPVDFRYISVDINEFQKLAQTVSGTTFCKGDATNTNLKDRSIDFLFHDEVVDCFTHRIFEWDADRGRITGEAFVKSIDSFFNIVFSNVEEDEKITQIESHLREQKFSLPYYKHSELDDSLWKEAKRILKPRGYHVLIDYTDKRLNEINKDGIGIFNLILNLDNQHDITRGINIDYTLLCARNNSFLTVDQYLFEKTPVRGRYMLTTKLS